MPSAISTLIIPVENQVRELDAKLLLACVAAERGFSVVLGSRAFIHHRAASIPRGVYLAKSMRRLSDRMFEILCDLGHHIVAWDEEALIRSPDAYYYERRLSARAIQQVAVLFAWGPDDARLFRGFPGYVGTPIEITGNPRVDVMRRDVRHYFDADVEQLRRRHGRFVLVNTNFGLANHFVRALEREPANEASTCDYGAQLAAHRKSLFERFAEMIPALSDALPRHTILIRPHPVERHDTWMKIAQGHPNVRVVQEGSVIPWLMACEALIQNACTTAVEAAILDTPAISYEPIASDRFDVPLVRDLTHRAASLRELLETTRSVTEGELGARDFPGRSQRIAEHVAGLDGRLASERMIDALERRGYAQQRPPSTGLVRTLKGRTHNRLRTVVKRINARRPEHRNYAGYHAHRFPDISVREIEERIGRFARQLGRFEKIRAEQRARHVFEIYS